MKNIISFLLVLLISQMNAQCWHSISAGNHYSMGIKTGGISTTPRMSLNSVTLTNLSAETFTGGTLWTWGSNNNGQLGDATIYASYTPHQVGTGANWQSVAAGDFHVLSIKTDGTLWTWGYNYFGQLGDGTLISKNNPTQIGIETNWQSISAGYDHSMGIKTDGTLWTWGDNHYGQLGDGSNSSKFSPIQIGIVTNWQSISAGNMHSLGIKADGTLWAWGFNGYGQLGYSSGLINYFPVKVGTGSDWQSISAGEYYSLGIKTDGTLWAWGYNYYGQLGDSTLINKNTPTQIGIDTNWQFISAGDRHSMGIKTDGTLWSWGYNAYGQIGDGTILNNKVTPTQIASGTNWLSISAGADHSMGLNTDGTLFTWGYNGHGHLGDGTNVEKITPTTITCPMTILSTNIREANLNFYSFYPNPATDILYFKNLTDQIIDKIIITDILGRKIIEQKDTTSQINIQSLEKGLYQLNLTFEGKSYSSKFIKE